VTVKESIDQVVLRSRPHSLLLEDQDLLELPGVNQFLAMMRVDDPFQDQPVEDAYLAIEGWVLDHIPQLIQFLKENPQANWLVAAANATPGIVKSETLIILAAAQTLVHKIIQQSGRTDIFDRYSETSIITRVFSKVSDELVKLGHLPWWKDYEHSQKND